MRTRELNNKELRAIDRVLQLIDNECDGKSQVFADKVGIAKASVSHYRHHLHAPSQDHAYLIGQAFNINPMWVMGFDVPMEDNCASAEKAVSNLKELVSDTDLIAALKIYMKMSPEKKKRIIDIICLIGAE